MKILILGINYDPEIISTAVYSTALAEEMVKYGVKIEVVTAKPYFPKWEVFEGWRGFTWRSRVSDTGVRIVHCPLYVPRRPTGLRRILHHASFALSALPVMIWKALRQRPDIVFVVAPSMVAAPVGWLGAKIAGAKAWLHIQDFEVEAAFATGLLNGKNIIGRAALAYESWTLRRFDRVSSISQPMVDKLRSKNVPPERIYELRNWANLERITPVEGRSPMAEELGITTPLVALYSGNLANKQGLEIIPQAAAELAHRKDLTFVVCGDGPMREDLVAMSAGLDNIVFLPLQPFDRLNDLLGMADVHLLPQIAGAADLLLPSKLTNMLASGRPVIAAADPNTALGREVDGCGALVPPGDGVALAKAIEALIAAPQKRAELGQAARARALERWDMDAILSRLKTQLDAALSGKQA